VFWSPEGLGVFPGGGSPPQYVRGIERFFKDLQVDSGTDHNVNSVDPQYNDLTGAVAKYDIKSPAAILDTDPFPASQCPVHPPVTHCLTDAQIQAEVEHVAAVHHLQNGLSNEMFLLTPPNVVDCFSNQASQSFGGCSVGIVPSSLAFFCAYHQETLASPMWFYAYDPFVAGVKIGGQLACEDGHHPNGISDGELQGGLSHELNESITDPIPNDAWTNGTGANHGFEVGDQCALSSGPVMGAPLGTHNGQPYNQVINGHFYWYQEEWSNDTNQCVQRITLPPTAPTATFTAQAGSGLLMTFNATGSTAPGGVAAYSWQWNAVTNASTVETTGPIVTNKFPATGLYSTGLAVFGPNGQSWGTGGIINTGHSGFTPGFTFSTSGHAVTFQGRKNISRHPVTNYLWEFGDGSTGSGRSPEHTYAHPGNYKVEVVQFSGVGSAFPGAGAAPISVRTVTIH
jgi:hypothetical protein